MHLADTIAAISSAVGPAARMIVRVSGASAHDIARGIADVLPPAGAAGRARLRFAGLETPAWVYCFAGPHSYTGEDLVEFHLPGNPLLSRMLLDALVLAGARHAEPGEFTARAYFSGKLDLAEAEGVAATVAAHSEAELRAARQLLAGELARRLAPATELLVQTLALVEAGIDFSDEDVSFVAAEEVEQRIDRLDNLLEALVRQSSRFEPLTHEPRIVLVGRPNAGKSTLLNALAGHERAVVSPHAGTTRDALSAEVRLRRGMVRMIDVAGTDEAPGGGEIERQMTEQARRAMESADFIVLARDVTDARPPLNPGRQVDLAVLTKVDLRAPGEADCIAVSAATGEGMDLLRERLDQLAFGSSAGSPALALNARHVQALSAAREALSRARAAARSGAELLAVELREALDALGQVLGQVTPDDVLGRIFAAFCIGK